MLKNSPSTPPLDYATCIHADCPRAHECLRRIAYTALEKTADHLVLVNPTRADQTSACSFYRCSKPVRFARGFINAKERMFPQQYKLFSEFLINKFSRSLFFAWRRGDRNLTPKEQQIVQEALTHAGIAEPMEFDHYEFAHNWKN